jgi:hypothetical protein
MQDELNRAKALIQQKCYDEARQVIKALKHPKEAEWLAKIDEVERKNAASVPSEAKPNSSSARIKTSKPLPLLPEEERELLPRGKPDSPQSILKERIRLGPRGRTSMWLMGGKCAPLIFNYFRMGRPFLGVFFLILYIAWVVFALFGFGLVFVLTQGHNTNIAIFILLVLIEIGLPFSPRLLAWVQQEHYDEWQRGFTEVRRDYLANTPYHK